MRKLLCFCISALLTAAALCSCNDKKPSGGETQPPTSETATEPVTVTEADTEPADNSAAPFIGNWETYKVSVNGDIYETSYAGYPLSSVAKLVIKEDNTAEFRDNLNPRGKERILEYKWSITSDKSGDDVLHLLSPDDRFDCTVSQGEMTMINADMGDESDIYYLLPVSEFTVIERPTEAGLDKVDYSKFMGKWEACEVRMDEEVFSETLGDYPVNVSFQIEIKKDNTALMAILNESQPFEWEPEKKDQLYLWNDMEGFSMTIKNGQLVLDNENPESPFVIKMKKVDKFTEYDFEAVADSIPDENIILDPEEEPET